MSDTYMIFPRYIYAIGGAGKELIYAMLEKEWILREILKPKPTQTRLDIIIVDTAIDEKNNDIAKIDTIKENIAKLKREYNELPTTNDTGTINISYELLTEQMVLTSPADLVGIGDKIKEATGASVWWINDEKELGKDWSQKVIVNGKLDTLRFKEGVYRKRAISKAIYYKAIANGLFKVKLLVADKVDIIAGLGGGTGSGIAIDLAKKLKEIQPLADITLFGILSTLKESRDEKANCFAMLTELEYEALKKESPFENIILVPMEVTGYPGRQRALDYNIRLLKEFDETFPYILISYHNLMLGKDSYVPDSAPFIIAAPQLIKYNVEFIRAFKNKLSEALEHKEKSLENEIKIFKEIRNYLDVSFPEIFNKKDMSLTDSDKAFIDTERFSKLKKILEHKFFENLDYEGIKSLKRSVKEGDSDDIEVSIRSIKSQIDTAETIRDFKDNTDSRLYNILKKDINHIVNLVDIFHNIYKIDDELVKKTLDVIVKLEINSLGDQLHRIENKIKELNAAKSELEDKVKILNDKLNKYNNKADQEVNNANQEWKKNNEILETLDLIDKRYDSLVKLFDDLKKELNQYAIEISSLEKIRVKNKLLQTKIDNIIYDISAIMRELNLKYDDATLIENNLILLKEFRKEQLLSKTKLSFMDKFFKTRKYHRKIEAGKNAELKKAELNKDGVFSVEDKNYFSVYNYDIDTVINNKKKDVIKNEIEIIKRKYPKASHESLEKFKNDLKNSATRSNISLEEIVYSNLNCSDKIKQIEDELNQKSTELENIKKKNEIFKNLEKLLKEIINPINSNFRNLKEYHEYINNLDKNIPIDDDIKDKEIHYVIEKKPMDIFKATVEGATINTILDEKEKKSLKNNIRDAFERTIDNEYNLLLRNNIESKDHTKKWDKFEIICSIITKANITADFANQIETIRNAFNLEKNKYSELLRPWGDVWSVGIVLFIMGVPLDNIKNVVDSGEGFFEHYRKMKNKSLIETFLHHAYLLEQGKFVNRIKIFNLEKDEDKELFLKDDKEIIEAICKYYEIMDLRDVANQDNI